MDTFSNVFDTLSPLIVLVLVIWFWRRIDRMLGHRPRETRPYNAVDYYCDTEIGRVPKSVALWRLFWN